MSKREMNQALRDLALRRSLWAGRGRYRATNRQPCPFVIRGIRTRGHYCGDDRHPVANMLADRFDVIDHAVVWRLPDGSLLMLAHVYSSQPDAVLAAAKAWAESCGLRAFLGDEGDDWYFPGHVVPVWYAAA